MEMIEDKNFKNTIEFLRKKRDEMKLQKLSAMDQHKLFLIERAIKDFEKGGSSEKIRQRKSSETLQRRSNRSH